MTPTAGGEVWSGSWLADRLDVQLIDAERTADADPRPAGDGVGRLRDLLGLALRRNPKRAHLLVSQVLGKHVPQRPTVVHQTGVRLGARVRALLGDEGAARALVLGYAETATGLGHSVADGLALAPYLHSTRRPVPEVAPAGGFQEEHSHATSHLLLPEDPELLTRGGPLILVDDEVSTGRTVRNTITTLHRRRPRDHYVLVALVDTRSAADRNLLRAHVAGLGARLDLVALAGGTVRLPADVLARGQALLAQHERRGTQQPEPADRQPSAVPRRVRLPWPEGLPDGGRHGFTPEHRARLEAALPTLAAALADALDTAHRQATPGRGVPAGAGTGGPPPGEPGALPTPTTPRRVLVLGCEELMYLPLRLAETLERLLPTDEIRYSSTTRSPVLAIDDPGYAIRTRISFPAHDQPADGPGERYAYNVAPGADPARRFDTIVAIVDSTADSPELHAPGGLLDRLAEHTSQLLLAVVPAYRPRGTENRQPAAHGDDGSPTDDRHHR